jgi:SAM-dependent methyltransferase
MDAQYAAAYPDLYRHHWWWRVREGILLSKIRHMLADVAEPRILDVGCGAALFFDALQQFGRVHGIESDAAAAEQSGRWRSHIAVGELDDSYEPEAPFDLILVLDVIEHVAEPVQLLRRAGEILAPGGRILITAPAFRWLWTRHDELNQHRMRYTAAGMRSTISGAGLVTIETGYMFQSLLLPKLLVRLREALSAGPARVPRVPSAVVNRAARTWFKAEYSIAGWLPFGASVLAVAANHGPTP